MRRPWEIDRRSLLRGLGVAIGLPLLEAMLPGMMRTARGDAIVRPKRLVPFVFQGGTPDYIAYGTPIRPGCLRPSTTGPGYALTPILQPFADLKDDILVVSNLSNAVSEATNVNGTYVPDGNDHGRSANGILSGVLARNSGVPGTVAGITLDQVAANAFRAFTPALPSLSLEVTGYYASIPISWSTPTSPNYPIQKPSDAFHQLFGDTNADAATAARRLAFKQSVLHHAKDDADRLRNKLGKADQMKLDEYLTSVESLEQRTQASGKACSSRTFVPDDGADIPGRMKQMMDLVTLAFQCDQTRVATFFLNLADSTMPWMPAPFGSFGFHAEIAHGAGVTAGAEREARIDMYVQICAWQMEQFAYLVRKLKNTPEGDGSGSLLDNSMLVCTSDMGYGDGHPMHPVPAIVAGRAAGSAITLGRHVEVPEQPISNLYTTMLNGVGVPTASFGNSTGPLSLT